MALSIVTREASAYAEVALLRILRLDGDALAFGGCDTVAHIGSLVLNRSDLNLVVGLARLLSVFLAAVRSLPRGTAVTAIERLGHSQARSLATALALRAPLFLVLAAARDAFSPIRGERVAILVRVTGFA